MFNFITSIFTFRLWNIQLIKKTLPKHLRAFNQNATAILDKFGQIILLKVSHPPVSMLFSYVSNFGTN